MASFQVVVQPCVNRDAVAAKPHVDLTYENTATTTTTSSSSTESSSTAAESATESSTAIAVVEISMQGTSSSATAATTAVSVTESERDQEQLALQAVLPPTKQVLLHSCCAPCSGSMIKELVDLGMEVTILWYNPNIQPRQEYEIRKNENMKYALKLGIPFVDLDYDVKEWYRRVEGMEYDPERGRRCTECFDMRMERTALYAHEHGFQYFTTTNATSRWKDINQVNASGVKAAARYADLHFWDYNWQTDRMTQRKYEISASERFYKQEYCGCSYSLRDTNLYRKKNGIPPVKIGGDVAGLGDRYFSDPQADAEEESQEVVDSFFASAQTSFDDERHAMYAARKKAAAEALGAGVGTDEGTAAAAAGGVRVGFANGSGQAPPVIPLTALNNW